MNTCHICTGSRINLRNVHHIGSEKRRRLRDLRKVWLRSLKETGPLVWSCCAGRRLPLLLPLLVVLLGVVKLLIPDVVLLAKLNLDGLGFRWVFCHAFLEFWDLVTQVSRHHMREKAREQCTWRDTTEGPCDVGPKRRCTRIHLNRKRMKKNSEEKRNSVQPQEHHSLLFSLFFSRIEID